MDSTTHYPYKTYKNKFDLAKDLDDLFGILDFDPEKAL